MMLVGVGSPCRASNNKRLFLASVSALALSLSASHGFAQEDRSSASIEEVIVTGSHIVRDGYEAPSPLTVVSTDQIEAGAREDLAAYINTMPAVIGSFSPQSQSIITSTGQTGVNAINLRGLGTVRTLVLLDGRRGVGAAADGTIDVSEFPQELISRVDVVTGGASAAYGSDAVAGVVNFILDKTYTGVKGSIEGGVSTHGDNRNWKVSLTGGTSFANDRGHFLISGSAARRDGLLDGQSREWNRQGYQTIPNPAYVAGNGQPQYLFGPGMGLWGATEGGIITNTVLKGTAFGPGGTPYQFNFGQVGGNYMVGGDWRSQVPLRRSALDPRSQRQTVFTRAQYDITDNFQVYGEASWANSASQTVSSTVFNVNNLTIKADNPFIPASVQARMAANGLTQFTMGRISMDIVLDPNKNGGNIGYFTRILNRYTVGANGNFDAGETNWKWEIYAHTGKTRTSETIYNATNTARLTNAIDAVRSPTTGAIVCRSTLTNPTNGCVPYNIMGTDVNSAATFNYFTALPHRNQSITQKNVGATINGEPFSTWAGPISVATGFEWRRDAISGASDAETLAFGNSVNPQPTFGRSNVAEFFGETVVPLASGQDWAQSLDVNAAVRGTHYGNTGWTVSYKIGATYQPVNDIKFRATRSHDLRAPNLGELYAGGSTKFGSILDPFNNNQPSQTFEINGGNPLLQPERSNTTQVGAVFQPSFLPGFSASIDYWHVKVNNVVGTVSNIQILTNCFNGIQQFCAAITRTPGLISYRIQPFNLSQQKRNGIDFETGYKFALEDVVGGFGGELDIRALATRYISAVIDNGLSPPIEYVGANGSEVGSNLYGVPTWVYNVSASYSLDPIRVTLTAHGFTSGTMSNTYVECTSACPASTGFNPTINYNQMAGRTYLDLAIDYKVLDNVTMFFAATNFTDLDPAPYVGVNNGVGYMIPGANLGLYDPVGRVFRAGVRFKM
jgi:iron complex outermembrane receptor protein